jgi:hypothetical protein
VDQIGFVPCARGAVVAAVRATSGTATVVVYEGCEGRRAMRRKSKRGVMRSTTWSACGVVLVVVGATWGCASAAASSLVLKAGTTVVPAGTAVFGVVKTECNELLFSGTLKINDQPTDEAVFGKTGLADFCEDEYISGAVTAMRLTSLGAMTVIASGKIRIRTGMPCVWEIRLLHGKFSIPGSVTAKVSGVGKRNSGLSAPTCPERIKMRGTAGLHDSETKQLLYAEVM